MIRVQKHAGALRVSFPALILLLLCSFQLSADSAWEGSAAVGRYGEFPLSGYYAATNAFPRNTALEIEHLGTGKKTQVIVVDRMNRTGLFMLLSRDAATEIGLAEDEIAQVRVVVDTRTSDLLTPPAEESVLSQDPDLNPAVSVGVVEDLSFLKDFISGEIPEPEEEPEPLLPPLDMEPEEEETIVEPVMEEAPAPPVLMVEEIPVRIPGGTYQRFEVAEIPEIPEVAGEESVLAGYDDAPLLTPSDRKVSRFVETAPEPSEEEILAVEVEEEIVVAETPVYIDLPLVVYPAERQLASTGAAPSEPRFEAPEVETAEEPPEPAGPFTEAVAMAEPLAEREPSLLLAAVPEEPYQKTETPVLTDYAAPQEPALPYTLAEVPSEPVKDVPSLDEGTVLVMEEGEEAFVLTALPAVPDERVAEAEPPAEAEEPEEILKAESEDIPLVEPGEEELVMAPSEVPALTEREEAEPEETPGETEIAPVPEDVEIFLEPAEMRPPEPVVEVRVAEAEEAEPEEEPLEEEPAPEEPRVEEVAIQPLEMGKFTLATDLAPSTHYLQLGVFSEEGSARVAAARIGAGYPVTIQRTASGEATWYKLFVGPLSPDESGVLLFRFRRAGFSDAFVRVTN